jgi:hypothetical protein
MIVKSALNYFKVDESHPYLSATLLSGVLADIPHDNVYHNNDHFREVICLLCLLIARHNDLSPFKLSSRDIMMLLMAACIHDFAHDGQGNFIKGTHLPSRLETRSFEKAKPFLQLALPDDKNILDILKLFLICTDVSRGESGRSPAGHCRDIYLAHEYDNIKAVNVPEIFEPLLRNQMLSLMALMLCEADIGMSTGLTYDYSKRMTCLVSRESEVLMPSANTLFGFMDVICHGGFTSPAAKSLMGENFQSIWKQAEQDTDNNILYA